jgi:hypothetical protein
MKRLRVNPRLAVIIAFAGLILVGLFFATGGNSSSSVNTGSAPAGAPVPASATSHVQGDLSVAVTQLGGNAWRFIYTIKNTGDVPIAGLQINAPRSNLYQIVAAPTWAAYGSGVCGGKIPGVLIYWSTGAKGGELIHPKGSAQFGFTVNTAGATTSSYSLSYGTATPAFGTTQVPSASSLPAKGRCRA